MREKPVYSRLRRLVDWINLTGAKKVHSLIDKVYKRKNLEIAWEKVKANRGSGGVDGQNLEAFETQLDQQLDRLQRELKEDTYQPQPVRQHPIQKKGQTWRVSNAWNTHDLRSRVPASAAQSVSQGRVREVAVAGKSPALSLLFADGLRNQALSLID
jgi:retron-type reverse transcriptase